MNLTKQQVFDAAWNGLKAQGFVQTPWGEYIKSVRKMHDGCLSCAAGHACKAFGVDLVGQLTQRMTEADGAIVGALIGAHDRASGPRDVEQRLREVAQRFGVVIPTDDIDDGFAAFMAKVREPVEAL